MTFEELKNGMKDLFSSLGAKTSDSNYAVGLFDKTSAEPKGIMDMASLASVLGASFFYNYESSTLNIDEFVRQGFQFVLCTPSTITGSMPSFNRTDRFFLLHYGGGPTISSYHLQVIWAAFETRMFIRNTQSGAWSAWKEL